MDVNTYGNVVLEILETDQSEKLASLNLPMWFGPISAALIFNKGSAKGDIQDEVKQKLIKALLETAINEAVLSAEEVVQQGLNPHATIANALWYIGNGKKALTDKLKQADLPDEHKKRLEAVQILLPTN